MNSEILTDRAGSGSSISNHSILSRNSTNNANSSSEAVVVVVESDEHRPQYYHHHYDHHNHHHRREGDGITIEEQGRRSNGRIYGAQGEEEEEEMMNGEDDDDEEEEDDDDEEEEEEQAMKKMEGNNRLNSSGNSLSRIIGVRKKASKKKKRSRGQRRNEEEENLMKHHQHTSELMMMDNDDNGKKKKKLFTSARAKEVRLWLLSFGATVLNSVIFEVIKVVLYWWTNDITIAFQIASIVTMITAFFLQKHIFIEDNNNNNGNNSSNSGNNGSMDIEMQRFDDGLRNSHGSSDLDPNQSTEIIILDGGNNNEQHDDNNANLSSSSMNETTVTVGATTSNPVGLLSESSSNDDTPQLKNSFWLMVYKFVVLSLVHTMVGSLFINITVFLCTYFDILEAYKVFRDYGISFIANVTVFTFFTFPLRRHFVFRRYCRHDFHIATFMFLITAVWYYWSLRFNVFSDTVSTGPASNCTTCHSQPMV